MASQCTGATLRLTFLIKMSMMLLIGILPVLQTGSLLSQSTSIVRFAVIGDYGLDGLAELNVANLVQTWTPDFIITVGDNNYGCGGADTIDSNIGQFYHFFISPYTGKYGTGASVNRFFPALGNHDWGESNCSGIPAGGRIDPYLNYFSLPGNGRYYDFTWGGLVHLFALDSDPREPSGTTSTSIQAAWLQGKLATSTMPWKLVYFHHPPYSAGICCGGITLEAAYMQWPFQAWGASAVLSGHSHSYERVMQNNFPYIVNGLAGGGITQFGSPVPGTQAQYNADFGALLVTATTARITFQFITRTGQVIDTYTILANPPHLMINGSTLPVTISAGGTVNVGVQEASGNVGDWIGEYRTGAADSAYLNWFYLNGSKTQPSTGYTSASVTSTLPSTPGTYEFRIFPTGNGSS